MCERQPAGNRTGQATRDMTRWRRGYPSKAQKTLSIYMFAPQRLTGQHQKFYNFLKINATLQKAHPLRKKT
jgi:hypothetical protein